MQVSARIINTRLFRFGRGWTSKENINRSAPQIQTPDDADYRWTGAMDISRGFCWGQ
jgi:hypothetical protein